MVAPVVAAAAISGGAKLVGGVLGFLSDKKAQKQQALEAQRQHLISLEQLRLSERMIDLGLATQIDAQGNITTYDEDTNTWRVIPTERQAQLMQAADDEILRSFNVDAPIARGELLRNSARRAREGSVADGMLKQVGDANSNQVSGNQLASSLRSARTAAVNAQFDDVGNAMSTQALRSGANGAGAMSQLARARAKAMAEGMGNPEIEGMQLADDVNASRLSNRINNYSAMATRASNADGFSPGTSSVAPTLAGALSNARQGANASFAQAGGMMANAGRPIQQPGTYNPAPLIGALGNAGADLFSALMSSRTSGGWTGDPSGRADTTTDWKTSLKKGDW